MPLEGRLHGPAVARGAGPDQGRNGDLALYLRQCAAKGTRARTHGRDEMNGCDRAEAPFKALAKEVEWCFFCVAVLASQLTAAARLILNGLVCGWDSQAQEG